MRFSLTFPSFYALVLTSLALIFWPAQKAQSQAHQAMPIVLIEGYSTDELRSADRPARSARPVSNLLEWFPASHPVIRQMIDRPSPDTAVVLLLVVEANGDVGRCDAKPFGAELDFDALCRDLLSIARFEAAANVAGAAVEDHYLINIVSWRKYPGGEFEHVQSEVAKGTPPVPEP